jgi:hypothetical protein
MYTVTRQRQWPEGKQVVEVSCGGLDYTNPDALDEKYAGEFQEFIDPREAVGVAIEIARAWRNDSQARVAIGIGATLGFTMPFEPTTFTAARKWATKAYQHAPKCAQCGGLLPRQRERFTHELSDGEEFCREYCAEANYDALTASEEEN